MIGISQQSRQKVEAKLAGRLRCPSDGTSIAATTVAEHIRATLFGGFCANPAQTLHTIRLLTNARRAIQLTWPRPFDARRIIEQPVANDGFVYTILRSMAALGDLWEPEGGQWLPTPLRVVTAESANRGLVLGTTPSSLAEQDLNAPITCAGPSRSIDTAGLTKDLGIIQTVDQWLGPAPALDAWTSHILETLDVRMENVRGLATDQLEIYAPDILRNQRRTGRWIAVGEVGRPLTEPRVCRPRQKFAQLYNRPHYLAHFAFKEGGLLVQRQAVVPRDVSLRLRFGLDLRLGSLRPITLTQSKETFSIDKPMMLPEPEQRAFSLGWSELNPERPTDRLTFHNDALPFVLHALHRLSIAPARVWRLS